MRKIITLIMAIIFVLGGLYACGKPQGSTTESGDTGGADNKPAMASVKVMSINIAGQDMTTSDNVNAVKYPGQTGHDYTYEKRRERLDALIGEYTPDVLFLQEVNGNSWWWPHLVTNADSFLNTFTDYTLVGRTNRIGGSDGAGNVWYDLYNQLYFDNTKFDAIATGMFYLNEKRDVPFSKQWHESAKYSSDDNNTCVWAVLKDKKTGVSAVYASTHLKPSGSFLARKLTNYRQAVNLADGLYKIADQYSDEGGVLPIIVGGDFNIQISMPDNYTYPHLTEKAYYSDAQTIAEKTDTKGTARVWGKNKTATGYDNATSDGYRIDIFFTQGVTVSKYQCLDGTFIEDANGSYYTPERIFDGGAYDLSDHLPIMMDIKVPAKDRVVKAPSTDLFRNTASDNDTLVDGGSSSVTAKKIEFKGTDLLKYLVGGQFMKADVVSHHSYGGVLRLMATESCPNVFINFDYDALMQEKGLKPCDIGGFSKIKIVYKTAFTVNNCEFVFGIFNEGNKSVSYGTNTAKMANSETFVTKTFDIPKHKDADGNITDLMFGTMFYADDYSGTCGLMKGDCIYIQSIEFIA